MDNHIFAAALTALHIGKWVRFQGEYEMESGELVEVEHSKAETRIYIDYEPWRGAGKERHQYDLRHLEAVFFDE